METGWRQHNNRRAQPAQGEPDISGFTCSECYFISAIPIVETFNSLCKIPVKTRAFLLVQRPEESEAPPVSDLHRDLRSSGLDPGSVHRRYQDYLPL